MRVEQLQDLIEIIHTGSIRTAANNLHITQQSLSASVKALEKELGLTLFERSAQGVALTVDGQNLLPHFQNLLHEYAAICAYTAIPAAASTAVTGTLRFACSTTISRFIIPKLSELFQAHYPAVTMAITEFPIGQLDELTTEADFDLILFHVNRDELPDLTPSPRYQTETLLLDSLVVTCSRHSPLAERRILSPSTLSKYPFAFFSVEPLESIWTYRKVFAEHGLRPRAVFQTNIESTFYGKLVGSDYLALSSKFCSKNFDYFQKHDLTSIALKDKVEFYYLLAIHEQALAKPFLQDFIAIIKKLFSLPVK